MVFYYETVFAGKTILLYRGKDKYENEDLIKYGWEEDVWFHVDEVSSAHIYMRLPQGMSIETIPNELIMLCSKLTKENSIEGCKQTKSKIVYTLWSNLKKTGDMAVGQVSFHDRSRVYRVTIEKSACKDEIKALEKCCREEENPNLAEMKEKHLAELRRQELDNKKAMEKQQSKIAAERQKDKEARSYDRLFADDKMCSNQDKGNDSDDFM
ncbi:Coiled-coil domain-containing protein 25 [Cichlidogyrus casuarinus]|uniref:Coiled-coil domain-containing protein 25 n=1 Tax=Cichlidogyrus casuarinus TaxID=1844966 RepID=A0ABD2QMN9_9PLAT